MELKPKNRIEKTSCLSCLNRTFYGIETAHRNKNKIITLCLNRTFYGIETLTKMNQYLYSEVLIVPFMELKLLS